MPPGIEPPIGWDAEAGRLRAQGKTSAEIAALTGKDASAVREVLRGTPRPPSEVFGARQSLVEPHVPRVPRTILDRQALQAAAMAFAAGEIDRGELMGGSRARIKTQSA
jgi:hypothetical protein